MHSIKSLFILNWRLLLKDKISFVWSLVLPTIMLLINPIQSEYQLIYWWAFIILNSFLFGVGLYALSEKDSGFLSIIFSIKWIPLYYFLSLVSVQIVYSFFVLYCLT